MILPDTNLLLYAFRNEFPEHGKARRWLDGLASDRGLLALHPLTVAAFLRLATRRLGPLPPAPSATALAFVVGLEQRGIWLTETTDHTRLMGRLLQRHQISGDGIPDAWLAALAITQGLTLASHDQGFARFAPELQWLDPLAPA